MRFSPIFFEKNTLFLVFGRFYHPFHVYARIRARLEKNTPYTRFLVHAWVPKSNSSCPPPPGVWLTLVNQVSLVSFILKSLRHCNIAIATNQRSRAYVDTKEFAFFSLKKLLKILLKYMMKIPNLVHGPSFGETLSIHKNIFKFLTLVFAVGRRQNFRNIFKKYNEIIISYFSLHEKDDKSFMKFQVLYLTHDTTPKTDRLRPTPTLLVAQTQWQAEVVVKCLMVYFPLTMYVEHSGKQGQDGERGTKGHTPWQIVTI